MIVIAKIQVQSGKEDTAKHALSDMVEKVKEGTMKGETMKSILNIYMMVVVLFVVFFSSAAWAGTHAVVAEKPYILTDGRTGVTYDTLDGTITMNWTDKTRYGFFNAVVTPLAPVFLEYEFVLVAVSQSDAREIKGIWDVYVNGSRVCEGCVGTAYGLNAPVGQYFKLYIGDQDCNDYSWHLSGYVTHRTDY